MTSDGGKKGCLSTASIAKMIRRLVTTKFPESHVVVAGSGCIYEILPGGSLIEQNVVVAGSAAPFVVPLARQLLETMKAPTSPPSSVKASQREWTATQVALILQGACEGDLLSGGKMRLWVFDEQGLKQLKIRR